MKVVALVLGLVVAGCGPARTKQAQEIASHDLADPAAAQFREVKKAGDHCMTGEINGKNRMGAYTGFRPFIVDLDKKDVAIAPDDGPANDLDRTLARTRMGIYATDCGIG